MSEWGSMSRELFTCIVNNTPDLRDLLQLSGTCRMLRSFYKNTAWLCYAARYHLIRVRDPALLLDTLQVRSGLELSMHDNEGFDDALNRDHARKTEDALAMLLWRKHLFNLYRFGGMTRLFARILGEGVSYTFCIPQYDLEGNVTFAVGRSGSGRWCRFRAHNLDYDITRVELFEWLAAEAFPGTFSWRLIHAPDGECDALKKFDRLGLNRGTIVQLIFRSDINNNTIDQPLLATLRKSKSIGNDQGFEDRVRIKCHKLKI